MSVIAIASSLQQKGKLLLRRAIDTHVSIIPMSEGSEKIRKRVEKLATCYYQASVIVHYKRTGIETGFKKSCVPELYYGTTPERHVWCPSNARLLLRPVFESTSTNASEMRDNCRRAVATTSMRP